MIFPSTLAPAPAAAAPHGSPVPCALDRHLGPFEGIPELGGWLGTDWYVCRRCRSTITLATVAAQRPAA